MEYKRTCLHLQGPPGGRGKGDEEGVDELHVGFFSYENGLV